MYRETDSMLVLRTSGESVERSEGSVAKVLESFFTPTGMERALFLCRHMIQDFVFIHSI